METFKINLFSLLKSNHLIEIDGLLLCNVVMANESILKATCISKMPIDFYFEDQQVILDKGICRATAEFNNTPTVAISVKVVRNPIITDFNCLF
jgi:hypothetical protein